jgi:hypothetical protein
MQKMPMGFPLAARDRYDEPIAVGDVVRILTVTSCLKGLPQADRERLQALVGETRIIEGIDPHGFVWFSVDARGAAADFSLFPGEVTRALTWSGKKSAPHPKPVKEDP